MFQLIKRLLEGISFAFERVGWKGRDLILPFVNLLMLQSILWWMFIAITEFKKYVLEQKVVELFQKYNWNVDNPPNYAILDPILEQVKKDFDFKVLIFLGFILFAIAFEIISRILNARIRKKVTSDPTNQDWAKKDTYQYIITIFDRLFASGLYLYPTLEIFQRYQHGLFKIWPEYKKPILIVIGPLCKWYFEEVNQRCFGLISPILFFFLYYAIARNRDNVKYFIRYHGAQALLMNSIFLFIGQVGDFYHCRNENELGTSIFAYNMIWTGALLLTPMIISSIIGVETRLLFVDQAIQYHIGPRPKKYKKDS
jgi:hypothetical protein